MKNEKLIELGYEIRDNPVYMYIVQSLAAKNINSSEANEILSGGKASKSGFFNTANFPANGNHLSFLSCLQALDFYFGLDLTKLAPEDGISRKMIRPRKFFDKGELEKVYKYKQNSGTLFFRYIPLNEKENETLNEVYQHIISFINGAEKTITAHEVMFSGKKESYDKSPYTEAQKSLLDAITEKIRKSEEHLHYTRIFHLTPSELRTTDYSTKEKSEDWVTQCSPNSFEHVYNLINSEFSENAEFFCTIDCLFQSMLIIDDKYLITEQYFNKDEKILPCLISIDQISNPMMDNYVFESQQSKVIFQVTSTSRSVKLFNELITIEKTLNTAIKKIESKILHAKSVSKYLLNQIKNTPKESDEIKMLHAEFEKQFNILIERISYYESLKKPFTYKKDLVDKRKKEAYTPKDYVSPFQHETNLVD